MECVQHFSYLGMNNELHVCPLCVAIYLQTIKDSF